MADNYPTLDTTTYDLIISGTGFVSSILAAAAAVAGKSVLHIDPNPYYGSHFASLKPSDFSSFLASDASQNLLEISGDPPESSRSFSLDLAGPRLLYCAEPLVDLIRRTGAVHHVRLQSVDGSLIYWDGALCSVPDSRQAIFRDRSLGLGEKREMTKFLKLVLGHIANEDGIRISEEEMEMPFTEFLKKQKLPPKIRAIVLYAITMADYDQESIDGCKKLMKTKEGIERIALYSKSIGRFTNAIGAFMYPIYGHSDLPQAFCRCAAVKGALYVLGLPVVDLLVDEGSKEFKGVKLASGQEVFSNHLIMEPSSMVPSSILQDALDASKLREKVVRGVCITTSSLQQDLSNILVIFPPRSLCAEQLITVRGLQLSSNAAVCPQGMFVVYLSALCNDANLGKEYIRAAMNALFPIPTLNDSKVISSNDEDGKASKRLLLWSAIYVQEVTQAIFDTVCLCPMPDANLDYRDLLESAIKLFSHIFPGEEFLPELPASENPDEDESSSAK